jgi:chemotaxis protein methyltransferase CheR
MTRPMTALPSSRSRDDRPPAGAAEFSFDSADFERVRRLIYQRAGISLHAGKQAMVYSRLSRRLRQLGHRSFGSYLQWLEAAGGEAGQAEWQEFVNCLTTNLTSFFREEHHFGLLADGAGAAPRPAPAPVVQRRLDGRGAVLAGDDGARGAGRRAGVEILCSDIDTKVLAAAERGVYAADARGLSAERLRRHFLRGTGANSGQIRVRPELSACCAFARST